MQKSAESSRGDGGFDHGENDRGGPFLADTQTMAAAFVALHGSTGERRWLTHAAAALDFIDATFRSAQAGYVSHPVSPEAIGAFAEETVVHFLLSGLLKE